MYGWAGGITTDLIGDPPNMLAGPRKVTRQGPQLRKCNFKEELIVGHTLKQP